MCIPTLVACRQREHQLNRLPLVVEATYGKNDLCVNGQWRLVRQFYELLSLRSQVTTIFNFLCRKLPITRPLKVFSPSHCSLFLRKSLSTVLMHFLTWRSWRGGWQILLFSPGRQRCVKCRSPSSALHQKTQTAGNPYELRLNPMDAKVFRVANLFFLPLPGLRSADVHRTILSAYPLVHRIPYLNSLLPWGENSLYQSFYS